MENNGAVVVDHGGDNLDPIQPHGIDQPEQADAEHFAPEPAGAFAAPELAADVLAPEQAGAAVEDVVAGDSTAEMAEERRYPTRERRSRTDTDFHYYK